MAQLQPRTDLQSLANTRQHAFPLKNKLYSAAYSHEIGHISGGSLRTSSIMSSPGKLFLWQTLHSLNRASLIHILEKDRQDAHFN